MIYHGTLYSYHGTSLHNHSTTYLCHGMPWNTMVHLRTTMVQISYTMVYVMVSYSATFMKVYYITPKFGIPWYNLPCIYHCVFRSIYPLMNLYHLSNVWNKRFKKQNKKQTKITHSYQMFWLWYNVSQLLDHSSVFVELLLQENTYHFSCKLYSKIYNSYYIAILYRKDSCSSQSHLDYNVLYVCHIIKPPRGLNSCTY